MQNGKRFAALQLLVCLLGCAHGTVRTVSPAPADLVAGPIGGVTIALSPDLPESRRTAYTKHQGDAVIQQAIRDAFETRGQWDPASTQTIHLTVTVFRLRSTANAAINGFFAGIDLLEGRAELRHADTTVMVYEFKTSGAEDQYFKYSSGARFRSLARSLGSELADAVAPAT
jgi:hypothetical protein